MAREGFLKSLVITKEWPFYHLERVYSFSSHINKTQLLLPLLAFNRWLDSESPILSDQILSGLIENTSGVWTMSSEEKRLYFPLQLHPDVIHIHHSYATQYVNYRSDLKRLVRNCSAAKPPPVSPSCKILPVSVNTEKGILEIRPSFSDSLLDPDPLLMWRRKHTPPTAGPNSRDKRWLSRAFGPLLCQGWVWWQRGWKASTALMTGRSK